jgi:hypothetical protein
VLTPHVQPNDRAQLSGRLRGLKLGLIGFVSLEAENRVIVVTICRTRGCVLLCQEKLALFRII